jgi:hypothetical protein
VLDRRRHSGWLLLDHRPEVQPGGLPESASLIAVLPRYRNDQVGPVEHDLGAAHADTVDPLLDDLSSLVEGLPCRWSTIDRPRGQRHSGAALQVDTQLWGCTPTTGEVDQRVEDGNYPSEDRQIAPRAEAPGRWCHGGWFSSINSFSVVTS